MPLRFLIIFLIVISIRSSDHLFFIIIFPYQPTLQADYDIAFYYIFFVGVIYFS